MLILSKTIKQKAYNHGFTLCGIAKAKPLSIEKERFEHALAQNFHAKKEYLERDIEKRFNPQLLLENCKSVVVCGFNYNMRDWGVARNAPTTARNAHIGQYAQIKDYHVFMKEKLETVAQDLKKQFGDFNYKITVDSSCISEKAWAVKSGIGYYGNNGIIQTSAGSFVFLGILLIDKETDEYDTPNLKTCGNCKRCIETCPANAIVAPYYIDSNRCITHLLNSKNEADTESVAKYGWFHACDVCQIECPINTKAPVNEEAVAMKILYEENLNDILQNLTPESFENHFKDTVLYKFGYERIKTRFSHGFN